MDKQYWINYYKKHNTPYVPSPFALSIELKGKSLLELGCGNGRDIIYFNHTYKNIKCIGIDQCNDELDYLNAIYGNEHLKFISGNFINPKLNERFDNIYSRFTLHSITESQEDKVLVWVYNHLNKAGKFFIEVRSTKDSMCGVGQRLNTNEFVSNHYRRFINFKSFKKKLEKIGFKIVYAKEGKGLAKHLKENPCCIRIIAQKYE